MIKASIRKHKPSTSEEYKNPTSFQSDQSVTLLKKNNPNMSNQSLESEVTQSPLSPALPNEKQKRDKKGQIQLQSQKNYQIKTYKETSLQNHRIRKQTESQHNKAINQFYKRKQLIARIMKSQDKMKLKKNQIYNKFQNVSKGTLDKRSLHSFQSRDTSNSIFLQNNRFAQFMQNSKIINNQKILAQLTQPYLSSAINLRKVNHYKQNILRTPFQKISRRQVYLSNISNLEQLRNSISHSRAKFNKKHIKMLREIGKYYVPFEDRLIGDENDVKGIFL